jgi:hypothetical protein
MEGAQHDGRRLRVSVAETRRKEKKKKREKRKTKQKKKQLALTRLRRCTGEQSTTLVDNTRLSNSATGAVLSAPRGAPAVAAE